MTILETRLLTKKYGDLTAVNGIDLSISAGEIFGLLGPNGAGKTTTINMLTGLAHITSGDVTLADFHYPKDVKRAQRVIGVVPDESDLYDEMSGFDNLCFCAALYGLPKRKREQRARGTARPVRSHRGGEQTVQGVFQGNETERSSAHSSRELRRSSTKRQKEF